MIKESEGLIVRNNTFSSSYLGLDYCEDAIIANNSVNQSFLGVEFSNNVTFSLNNITNNQMCGIIVSSSNDTKIEKN